jgi:hypothetical protein
VLDLSHVVLFVVVLLKSELSTLKEFNDKFLPFNMLILKSDRLLSDKLKAIANPTKTHNVGSIYQNIVEAESHRTSVGR